MLINISSVSTIREFFLLAIVLSIFIWIFNHHSLSTDLIIGELLKQGQFDEEVVVEDWRTSLSWSSGSDTILPQTTIVLHAPGMGLRPIWLNLLQGCFRMDCI